ncbi:MAG TPA: HhH-GPD-type base excision DNA repair protein [Acidimicrobiales bacterium]|nr:HhH-GPD-type base excision DNA repair protein [Acidimicrobiales bacterium]
MELHLSQEPEADALLSKSPFALLVGMVLDQQVPLEWAFASPLELERRLGKALDPKRIAQMDPEALAAAFSSKPALHRYPGSMAARVQELAKLVVERYNAKPEAIWTGADSGQELFRRVKELPGFGEHKAKIFVALLGKQLGVRPAGWESVSSPFSEPGSFRSVADITDVESLNTVRAFKQAMKAANKAKATADTAEKPPKKTTKKAAKTTKTKTQSRSTASARTR